MRWSLRNWGVMILKLEQTRKYERKTKEWINIALRLVFIPVVVTVIDSPRISAHGEYIILG